ncbi:RNA polymerase sigma-70 factor [Salmonirosea aquatica]|uniref:RNA polymerase sigma-70 factor n=1 Tax=Salmonirosea aquatica TaxID=2654236 RepID=A0A7C9BFP0_9BACT|nr:RNA polymerase sigma-70 factor [Cytophagaceae bacterium SJW1-29]
MEQAYPSRNANGNDARYPKRPLALSTPAFDPPVATGDECFIRKNLEENPRLGVELLYKRYYQPMCTHAVKFVGSREVAEDLVSEIFLDFYTQNRFLEISTSYRLYLFRTVRNRAYNYLRWDLSRKAELREVAQKPILNEQQPDQISQYEELYHDVEEAVNRLPLERRRIYLMRKFDGMKYQEIADELHLSVKTVDVQLHRANQFVRELLKEKWQL